MTPINQPTLLSCQFYLEDVSNEYPLMILHTELKEACKKYTALTAERPNSPNFKCN